MIEPNDGDLGQLILAVGAVGTAAMGFVEALKATPFLGLSGLSTVEQNLGKPAMATLREVYGSTGFDALLGGAWRKGTGEIESFLGTGLRLAIFSAENINELAKAFGEREPEKLVEAIRLLRDANTDAPADSALSAARARLARFEAVVDARVSSAVAAGNDQYKYKMHRWAAAVSIGGCLAFVLAQKDPEPNAYVFALIVGVLAVPVAPVAKDLTTFVSSVRDVFKKKGAPS